MHFVMPHLATAAFWVALWKIMVANVILSGDNAVVIAMAARNLTEKHRRAAIIFGGAGAIVLLIIFCGLLGVLLDVPYLKLVGGLLLLWIGIKLVGDEEEGGDVKAHEQLWPAIWSIAFANTVMSLDNAIAITAAANGDFFLMCMGLIISVPDHHRRRRRHFRPARPLPLARPGRRRADRLDRGRSHLRRGPA